ncbi:MAG TPA: SPFH domain-containing protein [Anaerolineales bacterium]|nr:SPFH domain-containing protein [Anaerolineales bacterium]
MNIATVLRSIASLAWIAFIAILALTFVRASRGQPAKAFVRMAIFLFVGAFLLSMVSLGLVFLQADQYGVVISAFQPNGYRSEPLSPGLHWIIPLVENVKPYSIARQTYTMSSTPGEGQIVGDDSIEARTKDGQQVYIDASVIYALDPAKLIPLHITWQDRYQDNVIRPVARAAIRDAVAQYGVEEIVSTKRTELEQTISDEIKQSLEANNLTMSNFLLRNIRFSDQYAQAVEQKQIAEQQALQAKLVVEQKKNEAEQARQVAQGLADAAVIGAKGAADARVIQAQAEAQANDLINKSLTQQLLQYQYITKLAPSVQTIFVPSGNQFILPLPSTTATPAPAQ